MKFPRGDLETDSRLSIDIQIELGRPTLYAAQQQVFNGVVANRAQAQGIPDGAVQFLQIKGLQKAQDLHVFPLKGERAKRPVCGLHVPWNVSLCSAALNLSKGAKFSDKDAVRVERDHKAWLRARDLVSRE